MECNRDYGIEMLLSIFALHSRILSELLTNYKHSKRLRKKSIR